MGTGIYLDYYLPANNTSEEASFLGDSRSLGRDDQWLYIRSHQCPWRGVSVVVQTFLEERFKGKLHFFLPH